jgi:hypothetical protein
LNSIALNEAFLDEYNVLSAEEKQELVEEHRQIKDRSKTFQRPTAKGRIEDVTHTVTNLKRMVCNSSMVIHG